MAYTVWYIPGYICHDIYHTEENKRELSVPCFSLQLPNWSNSTVEEKLWPCIPQKAFLTEIHVCLDIELVGCLWTKWIWGLQADRDCRK
jgi:hypothetical protein